MSLNSTIRRWQTVLSFVVVVSINLLLYVQSHIVLRFVVVYVTHRSIFNRCLFIYFFLFENRAAIAVEALPLFSLGGFMYLGFNY